MAPKLCGVVALVVSLALAGCSKPTQPLRSSPSLVESLAAGASADRAGVWVEGTFATDGVAESRAAHPSVFPLQVGNRWNYSYEVTYTPASRSPEYDCRPYKVIGLIESELTCARESSGQQLFVQETKGTLIQAPWVDPGNPVVHTSWAYYRQDASGLYGGAFAGPQIDPCENPSAPVQLARAPHGSLDVRFPELSANAWAMAGAGPFLAPTPSGESIVLGHPLHVGARWAWDESGLYGQEVEAIEVLDLPIGRVPAYRIRLFGFPPGWRITWWYGRAGLLKRTDYGHLECSLPPCGCGYVVESTQSLTDVELVSPPHR